MTDIRRDAMPADTLNAESGRATSNEQRAVSQQPRRRRGAISVEYLLILGLVVVPLAALLPLFISMIQQYAGRVTSLMRLPFP